MNGNTSQVIVIDDDPLSCNVIVRFVSNGGYSAAVATTGHQALKMASETPFHVAILDVNLPDIDGFEVCRRLKENPSTQHIHVIMLSGDRTDQDSKIQGLDTGADAYLLKPAGERELISLVRSNIRAYSTEQQLREEEQRARRYIENSPLGIFVADCTGRYVDVNETACTITGYTREELLSRTLWQLALEDDLVRNRELLSQIMVLGRVSADARIKRKDGRVIWISLDAVQLPGNQLIAFCSDITEKKLMQQALALSERRFRDVAENTADMVWEIDESGRYTYCSAKVRSILGYEPEDLVGKTPLDFMPPNEAKRIEEMFTPIWEKRRPFRDFVNWNLTADRRLICLSSSGTPIFDHEQIFRGYRGVDSDVTPRKMAERELQSYREHLEELAQKRARQLEQSEERFRQIAENIQEAFFLIDRGTEQFIYLNPIAKTLLNLSCQDDLDGTENLGDILHPDDRPSCLFVQRELRYSRPISEEFRILSREGAILWLRLRSFPVCDATGQVYRVAGLVSNITDYKMALEREKAHQRQLMQADKMASLGILVSGVAHEINNPNNLIMLNADFLSKVWKDALPIMDAYAQHDPSFMLNGLPYAEIRQEFDTLLDGIHQGSTRIKRIVHSLKDFIRIDAGGLDERIDVNKVIESAIFIVGAMIKRSTNNFVLSCSSNLPLIRGNSQQLEQVVINLVTNACQAISDKSAKITVQTERRSEHVRIVVEDEGCGIPKDTLPKIMDPFFTTKRDKGGTGLGLSVSYGIVQSHGGRISFESHMNKGTKVMVDLPVTNDVREHA